MTEEQSAARRHLDQMAHQTADHLVRLFLLYTRDMYPKLQCLHKSKSSLIRYKAYTNKKKNNTKYHDILGRVYERIVDISLIHTVSRWRTNLLQQHSHCGDGCSRRGHKINFFLFNVINGYLTTGEGIKFISDS